jgi:signal transduction histidine kinase
MQLMQSEKLKSLGQLVAGVAHELNNPIGFVHANLQLLDEFIEKLARAQERGEDTVKIRDAITKLLKRSREGTERVKQIVQDLRTFSRMDQADLQSAQLCDEIDRTIALMEPRFKGGVEVVRELPTAARGPLLSRPAESGLPQPADERLRRPRERRQDLRPHRADRRRRPHRVRGHGPRRSGRPKRMARMPCRRWPGWGRKRASSWARPSCRCPAAPRPTPP